MSPWTIFVLIVLAAGGGVAASAWWARQRREAADAVRQAGAEVVGPLAERLKALEAQVTGLEAQRVDAYAALRTQIESLQRSTTDLTASSTRLSQAMTSSGARGRWGELQLRRVVEMAGMQEHVDFTEQTQAGEGRPDLVVKLPGSGALPVDAKASMTGYLEALEAKDEATRSSRLDAHAQSLRQRVAELGEKGYWKQFEAAPEFVVMFVPIESALAAAFERRPDLLEDAIARRVLLTTPVTLLALLKAVAYGWQQRQVADNIKAIAAEGRQLHDRLEPFLKSLDAVGKSLEGAVDAYNRGVGSLHARVMPSARRLKELGASSADLTEPRLLDRAARPPESGGGEG